MLVVVVVVFFVTVFVVVITAVVVAVNIVVIIIVIIIVIVLVGFVVIVILVVVLVVVIVIIVDVIIVVIIVIIVNVVIFNAIIALSSRPPLPLLSPLPLLLLLPPLPPPVFAFPIFGWLLRYCLPSAMVIARRHATIIAVKPAAFAVNCCPLPPAPLLPLPLGHHHLHCHHRGQTRRPSLPKKESIAAAPPAYQQQHQHGIIYKSSRLDLFNLSTVKKHSTSTPTWDFCKYLAAKKSFF
jgi:hypothetical protein